MKIAVLSILLGICLPGFAQDTLTRASVQLTAQVKKGEIILRWAPSLPWVWKTANTQGYTVERWILSREKVIIRPAEKKILKAGSKPRPLDQWEPLVKRDTNAALGAQALYGDKFELKTSGNPYVQFYNTARDQDARFSFALYAADQSPEVAKAMGLWLEDTEIRENERYLYKVYLTAPSSGIDTGYLFVNPTQYTSVPTLQGISVLAGDKQAVLSWQGEPRFYTGYFIERATESGPFTRVNSLPYVPVKKGQSGSKVYFTDTLSENNTVYRYRVSGKTIFGQTGPWSDTATAVGVAMAGSTPQWKNFTLQSNGYVTLRWEWKPEKRKAKYYTLYSSASQTGIFSKEIDSISILKNEHALHQSSIGRYYKIAAVLENRAELVSLTQFVQQEDSVPPSPPSNVRSVQDTSGTITLSWSRNNETDLLGYRVYLSNSATEEFSQITSRAIADTFLLYKPVLNTLQGSFFMKVNACDTRFNTSSFSETIEVLKKDTVPPSPPLIERYTASDTLVQLYWRGSSSTDIARHILQKRLSGLQKWEVVRETLAIPTPLFTADTTGKPGRVYEYRVIAIDRTGNQSVSGIVSVRLPLPVNGPALTGLAASADRTAFTVTLRWKKPVLEVVALQIYKSENDGPVTLYKTVSDKNNAVFVDKIEKHFISLNYQIKARYRDGTHSPLSELVSIVF